MAVAAGGVAAAAVIAAGPASGWAASPVTCSVPPAWWARRSACWWRRPGGEAVGRDRPPRRRAFPVAAGLVVDRLAGEPPLRPHPVALFGRTMQAVEGRHLRRPALGRRGPRRRRSGRRGRRRTIDGFDGFDRRRDRGRHLSGRRRPGPGRRRRRGGRTPWARATSTRPAGCCPRLVGRDPSALDEKEIARAAVESVAENTVDAVVAPALWALAAGACRRARLPGRQHDGRHGGAPFAPVPGLRVGQRPGRRPGRLGASEGHRGPGGRGQAGRRRGGVAGGASRPPPPTRRPTPAWPRPPSPRPWGSGWVGSTGTAQQAELRPPLGSGRPPEPADIARAVQSERRRGLGLGRRPDRGGPVGPAWCAETVR